MLRRYLALMLVGMVALQVGGSVWLNPQPGLSDALHEVVAPPIAHAATCTGPDVTYGCTDVTRPYIPGTVDVGNHDTTSGGTAISLPFTFTYYGTPFNTANLLSAGNLQFNSGNATSTSPLPVSVFFSPVMPFWNNNLCTSDDCQGSRGDGGNGIFISTVGASPHRLFVVEWRVHQIDFSLGNPFVFTPRTPSSNSNSKKGRTTSSLSTATHQIAACRQHPASSRTMAAERTPISS